jgi:beta-lactamase class A
MNPTNPNMPNGMINNIPLGSYPTPVVTPQYYQPQ